MTDNQTANTNIEAAKAALARVEAAGTREARDDAMRDAWAVRDRSLAVYQQARGVEVLICPGPPVRRDGTPQDLMTWAGEADRAQAELARS